MASGYSSRPLIAIAAPTLAFGIGWSISKPESPAASHPPSPAAPIAAPPAVVVEPASAEDKAKRAKLDQYLAKLAERPNSEWDRAAARALGGAAANDPKAVAPLVVQLPDTHRAGPTLAVAAYWATTNPAATLAWLDTLPTDDLSWNARRLALCCWASVDSRAALAHFNTLPAEEKSALASEGFHSGETDLLKKATERPGLSTGRTFADELLLGLNATEAENVLVEMENSANSRVKNKAKLRRADDLFATDPAAAIALGGPDYAIRLAKTEPERALELAGDLKNVHSSAIIGEWARHDPDAAFEKLSTFDDRGRAKSLDAWRRSVLETDPAAAAETYNRDLDKKPIRGSARFQTNESMVQSAVVEAWFIRDPAAVTRWATSLTDHQGRINARDQVRESWRRAGLENADAHLIEHGFTAEELAPDEP